MTAYVVRRLLAFIPTFLVVAIVVFFMIYLIPGDPVRLMLGLEVEAEAIARKRAELGLDRPLQERLVIWLGHVAQGDLGDSYFLNQPVSQAIVERLPVTISLSTLSLLIAVGLGVSAGVIASIKQGSMSDWGVMLLSLLGLSMPTFWLALNLILLFAVMWQWFPVGGYVPLTKDPLEYLRHLFLPSLCLGLVNAAVIARMTRSSMLEVLRSDYVRTARAKGLYERVVVYKHALKNALIPVITSIGIVAGVLLGGAVITETVFNLPGVGRLVVEAVKRRDYLVVQSTILVITGSYLFVNLVVDLIYTWANPRIRYD
jgi:peptide/nickel transport system permease protein